MPILLKLDPRQLVLARYGGVTQFPRHITCFFHCTSKHSTQHKAVQQQGGFSPSFLSSRAPISASIRLLSVPTQHYQVHQLYSAMSSLQLASCFLTQTNANLSKVVATFPRKYTANNNYPLASFPGSLLESLGMRLSNPWEDCLVRRPKSLPLVVPKWIPLLLPRKGFK